MITFVDFPYHPGAYKNPLAYLISRKERSILNWLFFGKEINFSTTKFLPFFTIIN